MMAYYMAYPVGRMLCRAVIVLLLAFGVMQQCVAVNLRTLPLQGVYLTQDGNLLRALAQHSPGTYWIDGYQITILKQSQICWHDAQLRFGSNLNRYGQPVSRLNTASQCVSTPVSLGNSAWLEYLGSQEYYSDIFKPSMKVVTARIDVWTSEDNGNETHAASMPNWRALCASTSPHEVRYPSESPIDIVCDAKVNSQIENVFSSLLKPSAHASDAPLARQEMPSFYVVKPFRVRRNYDFGALDGSEASCASEGGGCTYKRPHAHSTVREIVYAPDGTVLIPDTALAHLNNEAELAALLSYSLAATDQHLIGRLFRVQLSKGNKWSLSYKASGRQNEDRTGGFVWNLNEQIVRLGTGQLYRAGYDIRYAPLAWAAEQGKQIKDMTDSAKKNLPWYAEYAFNYISKSYPTVDYTQLKRGEAEYKQFLKELRVADPEAFAGK